MSSHWGRLGGGRPADRLEADARLDSGGMGCELERWGMVRQGVAEGGRRLEAAVLVEGLAAESWGGGWKWGQA